MRSHRRLMYQVAAQALANSALSSPEQAYVGHRDGVELVTLPKQTPTIGNLFPTFGKQKRSKK